MTDLNRAEEILSAEECNETTGSKEENKPVDKIEKSSEGKNSEFDVVKGIGNEGLEKNCEENKHIDEKQSVQDNHKELSEQKDDGDVNEFNVIKKETEQRKQCETKSNDEDIQNVTENCVDKINQRVLLENKDCAETSDKKQSVVKNEESKKTSAVGAILLSVRKLTSQTNNATARGKDNKKVGPIQCLQ